MVTLQEKNLSQIWSLSLQKILSHIWSFMCNEKTVQIEKLKMHKYKTIKHNSLKI